MIEPFDKVFQNKSWPGVIPIHNLYTAGVAGERFLRGIQKEGKLLATRCSACRKEFLPPKLFCPFCLCELTEWKEVEPRGTVETYTVSRRGSHGEPLDGPRIFAFIRLTPDGGLIHILGEVGVDAVRIGQIVEALFKPAPARTGSILDILYFRPCKITAPSN